MFLGVLTTSHTTVRSHLEDLHGIKMPEGVADPNWLVDFHNAQHDGGHTETEHTHISYNEALRLLNGQ